MEEDKLLESIKTSFESLQKEKTSPSKDKKILRKIRKLKNPKSDELRVLAAQWVVVYNMTEFSQSVNEKQIDNILKTANSDLRHSLDLLEKDFQDENLRLNSILVACDIAQKISDFKKLSATYNEIKVLAPTKPQLGIITLSIAPTLADWSTFYRMCLIMEKDYNKQASRLGKNKGSMNVPSMTEALHQMSPPGSPDLGIIYEIVKEFGLQQIKTPKPENLFEQTVEVTKIELDVEKIVAESDDRVKEIREQFEKEKENEFSLENQSLAVNGGLILIPGLSREVALMLVGPYFDNEKIVAEGYVDLQLQETDENGQPKMQMDPATLNAELVRHMPPELMEAVESGKVSPDAVFQALAAMNSNEDDMSDNPLFKDGMKEHMYKMAEKFREIGPKMMQNYGISLVRQQERMELTKVEGGYEGVYFVRNYNPLDKSDETSLMLKMKLQCEHLNMPAAQMCAENEIETGVDNLSLD